MGFWGMFQWLIHSKKDFLGFWTPKHSWLKLLSVLLYLTSIVSLLLQLLFSYMLPSLGSDLEFRLHRLRELWWIDCSMERDNVNALLSFLKFCPYIERLYVTVSHSIFMILNRVLDKKEKRSQQWKNESYFYLVKNWMLFMVETQKNMTISLQFWYSSSNLQIDPESYNMRSTKKFSAKVNGLEKLGDLELLKLEGFASKKEIFFAERLRPLFRRKPLILSKSNGGCLRRLVKVSELEKEGKYPYKFKEVKNFHETNPYHVHMKL